MVVGLLALVLSAAQDEGDDAEVLQFVTSVEQHIERLRGREFRGPVKVGMRSRSELAEVAAESLRDEDGLEALRKEKALLGALAVLTPDQSLEQIYQALSTGMIAGYYDPDDHELYCIEGLGLSLQYETLIHELYHALQDQHFDLAALRDFDTMSTDELLARTAWIEGDAEHFTSLYLDSGVDDGVPERAEESTGFVELLAGLVTAVQIPKFFADSMAWPYSAGPIFAQAVYGHAGWSGVDQVFAAPPRSSEHVLHPEKYLSGDDPPRAVAPWVPPLVADAGYAEVLTDTLGQATIELVISYCASDPVHAVRGSRGWGGDRLVVLQDGAGELLLSWRTVWDSERDAGEFFRAWRWTATKQLVAVSEGDEVDRLDLVRAADALTLRAQRGKTQVALDEVAPLRWRPLRDGSFARLRCGTRAPTWIWWSGSEVRVLRGRFLLNRHPDELHLDGTW